MREIAALVATLAVALAGCAGEDDAPGASDGPTPSSSARLPDVTEGGEPSDPEAPAARPAVSFASELRIGDGRVEGSYTLTNDSDGDVFVPNAEEPSVTGADAGVVVLAHRAFPWPDGTTTYAVAPQGAGTVLEPGETVEVAVGADLPLERNQPFGDDVGYGEIALPDPVEAVQVCVGAIASPYPEALGLQPVEGGEGERVWTFNHGNAAHDAQYLFCNDPLPLPQQDTADLGA